MVCICLFLPVDCKAQKERNLSSIHRCIPIAYKSSWHIVGTQKNTKTFVEMDLLLLVIVQ